MQHAGGCLIHELYPLTFSFATMPFSAFAGRGLVVKQCAMPCFFQGTYTLSRKIVRNRAVSSYRIGFYVCKKTCTLVGFELLYSSMEI